MQVRYTNTMKHLVALQKYVLRNTATGKKMMFHRFIAVESVVLFIAILFAVNHNRLKVLLGFLIVTVLAWIFRERSMLVQFRKDFKKERRKDEEGLFDKDRILTIASEGLTVDMGPQHNAFGWEEVELTGRDRNYVYIILTGVLHYVIPVSAFSTDTEVAEFLTTIETYRSTP